MRLYLRKQEICIIQEFLSLVLKMKFCTLKVACCWTWELLFFFFFPFWRTQNFVIFSFLKDSKFCDLFQFDHFKVLILKVLSCFHSTKTKVYAETLKLKFEAFAWRSLMHSELTVTSLLDSEFSRLWIKCEMLVFFKCFMYGVRYRIREDANSLLNKWVFFWNYFFKMQWLCMDSKSSINPIPGIATYDLDLKFLFLILSLLLCRNAGQSTRRMLKHTTIEAAAWSQTLFQIAFDQRAIWSLLKLRKRSIWN